MKEATIESIYTPIKEVFYVTDMMVINKVLANKLTKNKMAGKSLMIRASKEQIYDSLEQKRIGQSKINGFINVNELIQLCKKTDTPVNKKGYMIWEAIEDRELEYLPFTFLKPNMTISQSIKLLHR